MRNSTSTTTITMSQPTATVTTTLLSTTTSVALAPQPVHPIAIGGFDAASSDEMAAIFWVDRGGNIQWQRENPVDSGNWTWHSEVVSHARVGTAVSYVFTPSADMVRNLVDYPPDRDI
jgi:hypothetical protein